MKSKLLQQIYKFIAVGIFNTAIDLAVLNSLILITHHGRSGIYYSVFKATSFIISSVNSYFMNKYWTFTGGADKRVHIEFLQFFFISLGGFVVNVFVSSVVVNYFPAPSSLEKLWPTIGALCGTAIGLIWNYIGYKFIVFKDQTELLPPV